MIAFHPLTNLPNLPFPHPNPRPQRPPFGLGGGAGVAMFLCALVLPGGAPELLVPPCMRQRVLARTAGPRQGAPLPVRAPQRGLWNLGGEGVVGMGPPSFDPSGRTRRASLPLPSGEGRGEGGWVHPGAAPRAEN
jgi:hypothetical protein